MRGEMKKFKRSGLFKASNVIFNPETCQAYSYDWWRFVDKINGKVVFNNYGYSMSTRKHQSKVRSLLRSLNITVDFEIASPSGLQSSKWRYEALINLNDAINGMQETLDNPRRKKALDERRVTLLNEWMIERDALNTFINTIQE